MYFYLQCLFLVSHGPKAETEAGAEHTADGGEQSSLQNHCYHCVLRNGHSDNLDSGLVL